MRALSAARGFSALCILQLHLIYHIMDIYQLVWFLDYGHSVSVLRMTAALARSPSVDSTLDFIPRLLCWNDPLNLRIHIAAVRHRTQGLHKLPSPL